jgi:guanylate kinase
MLLVLSGPSGVGKDTVWKEAAPCLGSFAKVTTCTTRGRRAGEEEGVHYFFVGDAEFDRMIERDELLEWALVNGNRYGVPVSSVTNRLNAGNDVVCIIEVQGALKIRYLFPDSLLVFLKPPPGRETQVLKERIEKRGTENPAQIATRLQTASWEMTQSAHYDYEIVNDEVEETANRLCDIITREKKRREEGQVLAPRESSTR